MDLKLINSRGGEIQGATGSNWVDKSENSEKSDQSDSNRRRASMSESTCSSRNSYVSESNEYSVIRGFKNLELEKKFISPLVQKPVALCVMMAFIACVLLLQTLPPYAIIFFQIRKEIEEKEASRSIISILHLYFASNIRFLAYLVLNLLGLLFCVVVEVILITMFILKKPFSWNYRLILEFMCFNQVQLMLGSMINLTDGNMNNISFFCTTFFLFVLFTFNGLTFRYIIRTQFPLAMLLVIFYSFLELYSNEILLIKPFTSVLLYFFQWIVHLFIMYVNENSHRRNFSLEIDDKKERTEIKRIADEIEQTTNTFIPLKYFQKTLSNYHQTCILSKNLSRYQAFSKKQHFRRTLFIQADLVNFTEFCGDIYRTKKDVKVISQTLKDVFFLFDEIIRASPFVVVSLIGDAYVAMFERNIVFNVEKVTSPFDEKGDVKYSEELYSSLCAKTIDIANLMHQQVSSLYSPGLRIGICEHECYAQIFSEQEKFRFDMYGRGIELVDYVQKLAPKQCTIICNKMRNSLSQSYVDLKEFDKSKHVYEKKFECPRFFEGKKTYIVLKGKRNICTKTSIVSGVSGDVLDEVSLDESEGNATKKLDWTPFDFNFNQNSLTSSNIAAVVKKKKKKKWWVDMLLRTSDLYNLFTFEEKERKKVGLVTQNIWKERYNVLIKYINFVSHRSFKTASIFSIVGICIMILSPIVYFINFPNLLLEWKTQFIYWIVMFLCLLGIIFVQLLIFWEIILYRRRKRAAFTDVF